MNTQFRIRNRVTIVPSWDDAQNKSLVGLSDKIVATDTHYEQTLYSVAFDNGRKDGFFAEEMEPLNLRRSGKSPLRKVTKRPSVNKRAHRI